MVLCFQTLTGILLTLYYTNSTQEAFFSLQRILSNRTWAFLLQSLHLNGATLFFFLIYFHVIRGLIYKRYKLSTTWNLGASLLLLRILIAFIGYVLPYRNMRLWAATVITNLLGVVPLIGHTLVFWLWGDFYVRDKTLKLFFTLHFLLPLLLTGGVLLHVLQLHKTGRSTLKRNLQYHSSLPFIPFGVKDYLNLAPLCLLLLFTLLNPYFFTESDRYLPSNLLSSPAHITPEWYFLFAYAVLRAIPNKLGGVVLLVARVVSLYLLPLANKTKLYLPQKWAALIFFSFWGVLTFLGRKRVEYPYLEIRQLLTCAYFISFVLLLSY